MIAVVGPSGVGKDTVTQALVDAAPQLSLVRRVITRAADAGGEDYDAVSVPMFMGTGAVRHHAGAVADRQPCCAARAPDRAGP